MTVKKFDSPTLEMLRIELEMAINKVCADNGLNPTTLGNITFADKYFTTSKLVFSIKEDLDFVAMGMELVGRKLKDKSTTFTVLENFVDKKCVRVITNRGKIYLATYDQIKTMILQ